MVHTGPVALRAGREGVATMGVGGWYAAAYAMSKNINVPKNYSCFFLLIKKYLQSATDQARLTHLAIISIEYNNCEYCTFTYFINTSTVRLSSSTQYTVELK